MRLCKERLSLSYLVNAKQQGEEINIKLFRNGKKIDKKVPLTTFVPLVPPPNYFDKPPYFIYGGLVFTSLSTDLIKSWGQEWWKEAPIGFLNYLVGCDRLNERNKKEIIVLLDILPDDINVGYHKHNYEVITKVNGKEFDSFKEFVMLLEENKNEYIIFETKNKIEIVLTTKNIDSITKKILNRNNIPFQFSKNVAKWLGGEDN